MKRQTVSRVLTLLNYLNNAYKCSKHYCIAVFHPFTALESEVHRALSCASKICDANNSGCKKVDLKNNLKVQMELNLFRLKIKRVRLSHRFLSTEIKFIPSILISP